MSRAPDYVNQTINLADFYLEKGKNIEAGRLLRALEKTSLVGYRTAFNILSRRHNTGIIERAYKLARSKERCVCKR